MKNKLFMITFVFGLFLISLASAQDYVFSGYFNEQKFVLDPIIPAVSETTSPAIVSDFSLMFRDFSGNVISQYFVPESATEPGENITFFYFKTEIPAGAEEISFSKGYGEVKSVRLHGSSPQIDDFKIAVNNAIDVSWKASDMDNSQLFLSLYYQKQGSIEWSPVLFEAEIDSNISRLSIENEKIPGGEIIFKLVVSDYFQKTEGVIHANIPNKPPIVYIENPENGSVIKGNSISAMAEAYDLEDKISEGDYRWYLNNNFLGNGKEIELNNLQNGNYNLQVRVKDSGLLESQDSVNFVVDSSALPRIKIREKQAEFLGFADSGNEMYRAVFGIFGEVSDYYCQLNFYGENSETTKQVAGNANTLSIVEFGFEETPAQSHKGEINLECSDYNDFRYAESTTMTYKNNWCNIADINGDGNVDIGDFGIFAGNYGENGCSYSNNFCNNADINGDGKVDIGDMGIISGNYGKSTGACVNQFL